MNWPFYVDRLAGAPGSVEQVIAGRNAGICSKSATSAAGPAGVPVNGGHRQPGRSFHAASVFNPSYNQPAEHLGRPVRLSKDALNIRGFERSRIPARVSAMASVRSCIDHARPKIHTRGSPRPHRTRPIVTNPSAAYYCLNVPHALRLPPRLLADQTCSPTAISRSAFSVSGGSDPCSAKCGSRLSTRRRANSARPTCPRCLYPHCSRNRRRRAFGDNA